MREEIEDAESSSGVACDNPGLVTSFGLGAARLSGRKPEEAAGKQSTVIFHEPRAAAMPVPRLFQTVAGTGKSEEEVTLVQGARALKCKEIVGYADLTRHLRNV